MKNIGAIGRLIWPSRSVASGCLFVLAGGFVVQLGQAQEINQHLWGVTPYAAISATAVSRNTLYVGGNFVALPGIVWLESRLERRAGRVEIEPAAVEVDRHLEALATAEAA